MKRIADLPKQFTALYGAKPDVFDFAPGRVNLIGEHTDYNGGHVFPCALTLGTYCLARRRDDRTLRFYSVNFPEGGMAEGTLDDLTVTGHWTDYPKSVIRTFGRYGHTVPVGADLLFYGNLPDGAGLSSSAALEVLTGAVLRDLYDIPVTGQELALMGQFAENRFIGVNCGIMDQFASAMGKRDHALFLDTATLDFAYAPLHLTDAEIVIANCGVKHSLASSAYNDRRRECEAALAALQTVVPAPSLCALTPEQFEQQAHVIDDPVCRRRAKHAVYENQRTVNAFEALQNGDLAAFGQLMNASHVSLRDDYEVSCPELDILAELAWRMPGVYGSRMTGGGFGGCTVSIVKHKDTERFIRTVGEAYTKRTGLTAQFYVADAGDGAHALPL